MHGLSISPDLDTVTYTLADAIDPTRGWGLVDESWRVMESLGPYEAVKPAGSNAATRWFNLGDRDLATHLYRTARRAEGARLTDVTDEIRRAWNVPMRILPMSDDPLSTMVTHRRPVRSRSRTTSSGCATTSTVDVGPIRRQRRHSPSTLARSIETADVVVIAPSNPLVSIAPIRHLAGVDELLAAATRPSRRRVADRRRRGAQGSRGTDDGRTRPRADRRRRRSPLRTDRIGARHRPGRRSTRRGGRVRRPALHRPAVGHVVTGRSPGSSRTATIAAIG